MPGGLLCTPLPGFDDLAASVEKRHAVQGGHPVGHERPYQRLGRLAQEGACDVVCEVDLEVDERTFLVSHGGAEHEGVEHRVERAVHERHRAPDRFLGTFPLADVAQEHGGPRPRRAGEDADPSLAWTDLVLVLNSDACGRSDRLAARPDDLREQVVGTPTDQLSQAHADEGQGHRVGVARAQIVVQRHEAQRHPLDGLPRHVTEEVPFRDRV